MVLSSRSRPHVRAHAARCTPESRGHEAARHDVLAGRHSPACCQTPLRSQDTPSGAFLMPAPHGTESSRISCHHGDAASERTRGRDFVLEFAPFRTAAAATWLVNGWWSSPVSESEPAECIRHTVEPVLCVPCARTRVELAESVVLMMNLGFANNFRTICPMVLVWV